MFGYVTLHVAFRAVRMTGTPDHGLACVCQATLTGTTSRRLRRLNWVFVFEKLRGRPSEASEDDPWMCG